MVLVGNLKMTTLVWLDLEEAVVQEPGFLSYVFVLV